MKTKLINASENAWKLIVQKKGELTAKTKKDATMAEALDKLLGVE